MTATKLPKLPTIRELIRIYNLRAKQQLSQNFIMDRNVTDKIISLAGLELDRALCVEVGPGPGLLTRSILNSGAQNVVAVEKDPRFIPTLEQLQDASDGRFKVILGDMLAINHADILRTGMALGQNTGEEKIEAFEYVHLIGNLPFSVATPLLIQWLNQLVLKQGIFATPQVSMSLMFQREVGDRITAGTSEPTRGRLSVVSQSICDAFKIYNVPATSFVPRPKVDATVVQLRPLEKPLLKSSFGALEHVVRFAFMKRRKMLARIFKDWDPERIALLEECEIEPTLRPQDVSTEKFCQLAYLIEQRNIKLP
ncbi:hypothetical protein GGI07_002059 [Coemansia sp. Benny D115]|nr:hypothetical protein GGI07_002059 [Coemansia sp. Benny D115]